MMRFLQLLRVKQWLKNGFVVAPIFFAERFASPEAWWLTLYAAAAFSLAASAVYIINDMVDREEDRRHPIKCKRPLAAGLVSVPAALMLAGLCAAASASLLHMLPVMCAWLVGGYGLLNLAYSVYLKKQALVDVFFIASCFVLRVLVGCYALSVVVSPWILITTFMLALFLGFGKRAHELGVEGYAATKQNLQGYNAALLDRLVVMCGTSALVSYAIYTAEIARMTGDVRIVYTVVFVAYGLFRYLQWVVVYGKGGEPEEILLGDVWQWVNMIAWLVSMLLILSTK